MHRPRGYESHDSTETGSGAWFNAKRKATTPTRDSDHWLLRERTTAAAAAASVHQSMPPMGASSSMRDSGIVEGGELSRDGDDRSSFGMILKDKFQKNPNMYFPGDDGHSSLRSTAATAATTTNNNNQTGRSPSRSTRSGSAGTSNNTRKSSSPSKSRQRRPDIIDDDDELEDQVRKKENGQNSNVLQ